jgi:hypothetical protein
LSAPDRRNFALPAALIRTQLLQRVWRRLLLFSEWTDGAQALPPSATVFLPRHCNDQVVLGLWCNRPKLDVSAGTAIWIHTRLLSIILIIVAVYPAWPRR